MKIGSDRRGDICGWSFSILIHAVSLGTAIVVAAEFSQLSRPNLFQWDVSLVAALRPEPIVSDSPLVSHASPISPSIAADSYSSKRNVYGSASHSYHESDKAAPTADSNIPVLNHGMENTTLAGPINQASALQGSDGSPIVSGPATEERLAVSASDSSEQNADTVPVDLANLPVSDGTPDELPPPEVREPEQIAPVSDPAIREPERLAFRPTPQFRDPVVSKPLRPDYGWLADILFVRVQQMKRYPYRARNNRWQGNVVLQAVITEDGRVENILVVQSSGHSMLDQDAVALLERVSPVSLDHPLGQPEVIVQIPIGYRLE
jgi:protein TonB